MEASGLATSTCIEKLELWSSILTFLGGALLVFDTFSPVKEVLLRGGRQKWKWASARLGVKPKTTNPALPPQNDRGALRRARRSQSMTRGGFALITLGFLLDLMAKLRWSFVFDLVAKLHLC
jgi:hypothetical protein